MLDLKTLRIVYKEERYVASELACILYSPTAENKNRLVAVNVDQNLSYYTIGAKALQKYSSRSLYLDEVIDIKIFKPENRFALMCSNSETLKLMSLETGEIELYSGHTDIILCLDICNQFCITGAKDNTVRLWKHDLDQEFESRIKCLAQF